MKRNEREREERGERRGTRKPGRRGIVVGVGFISLSIYIYPNDALEIIVGYIISGVPCVCVCV